MKHLLLTTAIAISILTSASAQAMVVNGPEGVGKTDNYPLPDTNKPIVAKPGINKDLPIISTQPTAPTTTPTNTGNLGRDVIIPKLPKRNPAIPTPPVDDATQAPIPGAKPVKRPVTPPIISTPAKPTPVSNNGYSVKPGSNTIVNAKGYVVAKYNPANGQFTSAAGTPVQTDTKEYQIYKQAVATSTKPTVSASTPTTKSTSPVPTPTTTASTAGLYMHGNNEIVNADGNVVAHYNPDSGQFTSLTGTVFGPNTKEYAAFKQTLASGAKLPLQAAPPVILTDSNGATAAKALGEGFTLTSTGDILKAGSSSPVAKLDGAGNLVNAAGGTLDSATKSTLDKLTKGIKLPAGFGANDRVDPAIVQKNTYIAAKDDGSVYYGNSNLGKGIGAATIIKAAESVSKLPSVGPSSVAPANFGVSKNWSADTIKREWASMNVDQQRTWIESNPVAGTVGSTSPTAPTSTSGLTYTGGAIRDVTGRPVADYNYSTGQFYDSLNGGAIIGPNDPRYATYKLLIAGANPAGNGRTDANVDMQ